MPNITPDIEAFARIKVLGIGGSGNNAVNHMINCKVKGVDFVAVNTDSQDLHRSLAKKKIHLGKNLTRGLGTGMNSDLGRRATEETRDEIQEIIKGADMVFVTCGLGGGTGTGGSPMVARIVHPDLHAMFPGLKNPAEGAFVAAGLDNMPAGMLGLLISGIFGATMSNMDVGLNKNAGFFVKNFYH